MIKKAIFILALIFSISSQAQFLQGIGVFGSLTTSRHDYVNKNSADSAGYYVGLIPETHRSTERISWGAGLIFELFSFERFRLQSEIEYINKGAKELNELINPVTNERSQGVNKYKYIAFNNFAKFRLETFNFTSCLLIGPRIEYNLGKSTPAYPYVAGSFKKLWISPDVGIGFEPYTYGRFKFFTELHYNPDVRRQYKQNNVVASNRTWELRLGIMWRKKSSVDIDCNAPRYHGDY